jgi:cytochrome c
MLDGDARSKSRWLEALRLATMAGLVAAGSGAAWSESPPNAPSATAPIAQAPAAPRRLGIGREATPEEIAGWDIDVRPDGQGLPRGKGTVKEGEALFTQQCAGCHGTFGEGAGRWPALSGGAGTLKSDQPLKSIGSFWPYASTLIDFIRRAKPFGNAQSLGSNELYALTSYILYLNDIITDESFELNESNLTSIKLPNEAGFFDDERELSEKELWRHDPCVTNCKAEVTIVGRARASDLTPDHKPGRRAAD